MKRLTPLLAAMLTALSAAGLVCAAQPESTFGLAPSAAPQLPAQPATDTPLIPEVLPSAPTKQPASAGPNRTEAAEDRLRRLIKMRAAVSIAERDPGLQALNAKALAARTDYEQRALYFSYYMKLYDLVAKVDPTIPKVQIDAKKSGYAHLYTQHRVAPTKPPPGYQTSQN